VVENVENSLAKKFPFSTAVLELACYENKKRERVFRFEPFLADWARRKQLPSLRALPLEAD